MATSRPNQNSITAEYPEHMKTIKSVPVYQFPNGQVICKVCIEKLNNSPICRNDSPPERSLKLKSVVQKLKVVQHGNGGPTTANPDLQNRGKGSVRCYGTINGPNKVAPIGINLQANPRQANPRQANPRQANPRQTNPRQANPRKANPRQANPRQENPRQPSTRHSTIMINDQDVTDNCCSVLNVYQTICFFFKLAFSIFILYLMYCAIDEELQKW